MAKLMKLLILMVLSSYSDSVSFNTFLPKSSISSNTQTSTLPLTPSSVDDKSVSLSVSSTSNKKSSPQNPLVALKRLMNGSTLFFSDARNWWRLRKREVNELSYNESRLLREFPITCIYVLPLVMNPLPPPFGLVLLGVANMLPRSLLTYHYHSTEQKETFFNHDMMRASTKYAKFLKMAPVSSQTRNGAEEFKQVIDIEQAFQSSSELINKALSYRKQKDRDIMIKAFLDMFFSTASSSCLESHCFPIETNLDLMTRTQLVSLIRAFSYLTQSSALPNAPSFSWVKVQIFVKVPLRTLRQIALKYVKAISDDDDELLHLLATSPTATMFSDYSNTASVTRAVAAPPVLQREEVSAILRFLKLPKTSYEDVEYAQKIDAALNDEQLHKACSERGLFITFAHLIKPILMNQENKHVEYVKGNNVLSQHSDMTQFQQVLNRDDLKNRLLKYLKVVRMIREYMRRQPCQVTVIPPSLQLMLPLLV